MKSNNAKYIISFLWIALLFTSISSVNARSFSSKWSCVYTDARWYTTQVNQGSPHDLSVPSQIVDLYFNKSNFRFINTSGDNIVNWNIYLFNNGDYWSCDNYVYHDYTNYHYYSNYSYIKAWRSSTTIDSSWEFYVRNDNNKSYRHVSVPSQWYSENGVNFDMWFPYHWSVFFYDSSSWHTVQLIWNKTLYDKVLYIDPIETDQNVWVIEFSKNKAWSYHQDLPYDFTTYMLWLWSYSDEVFFDDLKDKFTNSYTISIGGTYALPPTAIQVNQNYQYWYSTETSWYWRTFQYSSDLNYQAPDWVCSSCWWDENNTWSSNNDNAYLQCINSQSFIKNIASNQYACKNTITQCEEGSYSWWIPCFNQEMYNALYNDIMYYTGGDTTASSVNVSCTNWVIKSTSLYYEYWSWNYKQLIQQANAWSDDPNSVDIVPYCSSLLPSSEQSWACQYLNIGCDWFFSIWKAFDYINLYVRPYISETIWEYERYFMSWYNYLGQANSCSSDMYWKSYSWWNFALLFVVAWLSFTIYSVFKD